MDGWRPMSDLKYFDCRFEGEITSMYPTLSMSANVDMEGPPSQPVFADVVTWRLLADLRFHPGDFDESLNADFLGCFRAKLGGAATNFPLDIYTGDRELSRQEYLNAGKKPFVGSLQAKDLGRGATLFLSKDAEYVLPVLAANLPQHITIFVTYRDDGNLRICDVQIGHWIGKA